MSFSVDLWNGFETIQSSFSSNIIKLNQLIDILSLYSSHVKDFYNNLVNLYELTKETATHYYNYLMSDKGKEAREYLSSILKKSPKKKINIDKKLQNGQQIVPTHTLSELIEDYGLPKLRDGNKIHVLVSSSTSSVHEHKIIKQGDEEIYVITNSKNNVRDLSRFINLRRNIKLELSNDKGNLSLHLVKLDEKFLKIREMNFMINIKVLLINLSFYLMKFLN